MAKIYTIVSFYIYFQFVNNGCYSCERIEEIRFNVEK